MAPSGSLLERDAELGALRRAIETVGRGAGSLVMVEGPAGIGKSRLLAEAADLAGRLGVSCLRAQGAELERAMPFGVVRQLLAAPVLAMAADRRRELLDGPAAPAGAVLGLTVPPGTHTSVDQAQSVDAVYWLVDALAHGALHRSAGLVVLVDDAQWADLPSLRVLARLAVALDELPIAIVVAARTAEPSVDGVLLRLRGHARARVLRPAPLSRAAVATLVRSRLGDPAADELVAACADVSGGNPFLVGELVAALITDGVRPDAAAAEVVAGLVPEPVVHSVLLRLAGLSGAAGALARAAALTGAGSTLQHVAAVAEVDPAEGAAAARELVAAGLFAAADPIVFAHPMVGEALDADLTEWDRAAAHRRAAAALAADGAAAERIAAHLLRCPPGTDRWAVAALRAAAGEAMRRGEAPGAVRLLERALAESPTAEMRAEVQVELALAEASAGASDAIGRLTGAAELTADPVRRARSLQAVSRLLLARGGVQAAARAAEMARAELGPEDPEATRTLAAQLAVLVFTPGRWAEAAPLLADLERRFERGLVSAEPVALAQLATRRAIWAREGPARVRTLAELSLAVRPDAGELWHGDASMAAALIYSGEFRLAEPILDRMAGHARRTGSPVAVAMADQWRATLRYLQGRAGEAERLAGRALGAESLEWSMQTGFSAAVLARARLRLGDLAGARAAVAVGERVDPALLPHAFLLEARSELALATGDADAALRDARAAGEHLRQGFALANPAVLSWRVAAARALVALGDRDGAVALATEELADTRTDGVPHAVAGALRMLAAVSEDAAAVALLDEGVEVLRDSGAELERAATLYAAGIALRRIRRSAEARRRLQDAHELARELGLTVLAEKAERALGRSAGTRDPTAVLTTSERQVAELAAQDHSNAEIAELLHITRRTVESHLTQTYRKLSIRSRAGLAAALRAEDGSR